MKVALIGASGRVGSRILKEAAERGHSVTGISRNPDKVASRDGVSAKKGDVNDTAEIAPLLKGHDAVISAVRFVGTSGPAVVGAVKEAGVDRLLVVGGAASLEVAPRVRLLDTTAFPEAARAEANAGADFLNFLRREPELDWTFLSPSALIIPGERTGKFRLGDDELLKDEDGKSWISMEDFAVAMIDELEAPRHSRRRFTVGY